MEDFLDPLKKIQQVDVPPFLFTRIQQKIQAELENRVSLTTAYSLATAFIILLSINVIVLLLHDKTKSTETAIANSFDLMPDNNLYKWTKQN